MGFNPFEVFLFLKPSSVTILVAGAILKKRLHLLLDLYLHGLKILVRKVGIQWYKSCKQNRKQAFMKGQHGQCFLERIFRQPGTMTI
jgi:hypothetical protein